MQDSVGHVPQKSKWEFDASVVECFDDMLTRSIPQYSVMRDAVFQIAKQYVQHGTHVIDLGTSNGIALERLVDTFGENNKYIGVEVSEPMLIAAREKFAPQIASGLVEIKSLDLRKEFPDVQASVIQSILTIQFIPIDYRQKIITECYDHLEEGGVFILVEKVLGNNADITTAMGNIYRMKKSNSGYSIDEIDRKSASLEGVLVPVTAKWNEDMLREAGFKSVDCFWRWMNFAGWIAIK